MQFDFAGGASIRGAEAQRQQRRTLVRFETGAGHWAVAIDRVREIRKSDGIAPLPNARPGVAGVLRLGDQVLTVLSALGAGSSHVLVLDGADRRFGLLCESASGVMRIEEDQILPRAQNPLVSGTVETDEGTVMLLDVDALGRALS
jgi:chemotaxis signal transduction protein